MPQDVAVGKPVFRVLDLADDSLKSPKPRIPVSVDSFDDLKSRGHHRDLPRSGSALYVETQSAAEAGPNAQLTGPNVVTYAEEKFRPSPRSDIATRVVRQGRRTLGTSDGCDFQGEMVLNHGMEVSLTELSYDPQMCLSLVNISVVRGQGILKSEKSSPQGTEPRWRQPPSQEL